jgi:hypothetical protein
MTTRDKVIKILKSPPCNLHGIIAEDAADEILNAIEGDSEGEIDPSGSFLRLGKPIKVTFPKYVTINVPESGTGLPESKGPSGEIDIPGSLMIIEVPGLKKTFPCKVNFQDSVVDSIFQKEFAEQMTVHFEASLQPILKK